MATRTPSPKHASVFLGVQIPMSLKRQVELEARRRMTSRSAVVRLALVAFLAYGVHDCTPRRHRK